MAKWCDEGENDILNVYFSTQAKRTSLWLGLYLDDPEPAEAAALADLTEPSGNGYARVELLQENWTVADDLASYPQVTFTATGAWGNVYGYFIATSQDNSGLLLAVEHFSDGPYNIQNNGDQIKVTPKVRAS